MAFKRRDNKGEGKDFTQNKLYIYVDWVWKLFVINTLTIISCLGVITIVPAIVSCFRTIKDCKEEDETHYIKKYFENFSFCFKDTVGMGILIVVLSGLFFYAYVFYSEMIDQLVENGGYTSWVNIYSILLVFALFFLLIILLGLLQIPMVSTYFHFRFFDKLKFCFYMGFKYLGLALLEVLIIVVDVFIIINIPIYFFVFFFSLPVCLIYFVSRKCYWSVSHNQVYDYEEEDRYDLQGKATNRETYEDENKKELDEKEKELEEINNTIMNKGKGGDKK